MTSGEVVRVRVLGRVYLARILSVGRKVRCAFVSQVPAVDGRRRRELYLSKDLFVEHRKCGVDYLVSLDRR
jgi:hypothetical protein